jgi:ferric-dicitrate binding protein FerR (iron transport regulator)
VNAYDNEEAIKTTLLEGKVKTSMVNGQWSMLKPGEQAAIHHLPAGRQGLPAGRQGLPAGRQGSQLTIHDHIDVDKVMAWKNGYFDFNNADLPLMMRQLERWYDIQVQYKGQIPQVIFKGQMDRHVQLSDVIRFLKMFQIKARLEGRTLIITGN